MPERGSLMSSESILSPIMQFGFAGFSGVLLVILVWLINKLLGVLERNNQIISDNTNAINTLITNEQQNATTLADLRDKVLQRPCIRE